MPPVTRVGAALEQTLGQGLGVVGDRLGVGPERRGPGLGQRHRLGRHHVAERAAEHHRAAAVDAGCVLLGGQHHAAARAAQRLVGGRGDDVGVRDRVLVAGEHLAGDQAGEVRHVDHERGADLVGDLAHLGEVDPARVGRVAGDQDQRLELPGRCAHPVVVDQLGRRVGAVRALVEHLARDVRPEAVGEVAAGVQRHAERALVAELVPQRLPLLLGQVVHALDAQLGQLGELDPVGEDRPEGDQVGVDAGVRLRVGVLGAEQLPGVLGGERLDGVDVLAAGVEAVSDGALGVLVGQPGAHRQQHRRRGVVLRGDQLERRRAGRPARPGWRRRSAARPSRSPPARPGRPRRRWRRSRRRDRDARVSVTGQMLPAGGRCADRRVRPAALRPPPPRKWA